MKKSLGLSILVILFICFCSFGVGSSHAQKRFAFGIKPGMGIQNSYFGFTSGKFLPYASTDLLWMTVNLKETYDGDMTSFKGKAFVLIPHFGSRYYVYGVETTDDLKAYLNGDLYFSLPSVSIKEDGHEDDEMQELIGDVLSFWGLNLGFGAEYMVSKHFSVGGEYGFRLFFDKIKQEGTSTDYYYDPYYGYQEYQSKWEDELSLTLKMNYVAVALNYYF